MRPTVPALGHRNKDLKTSRAVLLFSCQVTSDSMGPMDRNTAGLPVPHHLPELAQTLVHPVDDAIQLSRPLLSPSPPTFYLFPAPGSFPMSQSVLRIRWPKYWSFSFSISPSNEYSGLISFRIDWFDLLAVQGRDS